ncbi:Hypothetical protein NCS54_00426000 [Fusarium falciforme]|uniref:Hypothetical protein n=1 Tax=Fusarium falciforme TaxID=195108 RepID=UPI00230189FE|nr:Hypothetical protein NCS54_00426000 [Fusarium falciforme]WAO86968.1 Hypothetical protein NCS54_00426000 [Fusarium falciforme]
MNKRVTRLQSRRSRPGLPQEPLLSPPDTQERSTKRQLDDIGQSPAKKSRLTDTQKAKAGGEGSAEAPALQHPRPKPPAVPFPQKFIDPPIQPSDSKHRFILEWLESVGCNRDRRCRSESHLQPTHDSPPVPPSRARSAPTMKNTGDPNDLAFSMPSSTWNPSRTLGDRSSITGTDLTTKKVEHPDYLKVHLAGNGIHFSLSIPDRIDGLVKTMGQARHSPGPSEDQVLGDEDLEILKTARLEVLVEEYFLDYVFPKFRSPNPLERIPRAEMYKDHVPNREDYKHDVCLPKPDALFGYRKDNAFLQQEDLVGTISGEMTANSQGLRYPFLVVEFKGDGGHWVGARNQCMGGSATCVKIAENLNRRLKQCTSAATVDPIDSAVFSIAIRCTEARLFVSWSQDDQNYFMAEIDSFLLHRPKDYIEFYKYVHNIVDWGRGERLKRIRESLDLLQEEKRIQDKESQEKALAAAKLTSESMPEVRRSLRLQQKRAR